MATRKSSSRGRQASGTSRNSDSQKKAFSKSKSRFNKESRSRSSIQKKTTSDTIRLNKYIANSGICSRREADTYIKTGSATVNGKVITEMGFQVNPGDEVRFEGSLINPEVKRYVLLNKPKNYLTNVDDERGRKTVMELIHGATKERIYPVGRLDRNTTGLLLFTNDGDLAKKLTQPKIPFKKLYQVSLDKKLAMKDLKKIEENVLIEGKMVFIDAISYIENQPKTEVGIEIHSGRNRIVNKIFEHFGYKVTKLDRVLFAELTKKNLPRGHWRHLTQQEVNNLKMI
ncbi:MAG: rRNA pseudouridine synthase [Flavobacteriaceae bacterium]|nr:rRNA pseudouridine synthase [Flavobacteriaceae bacterium]